MLRCLFNTGSSQTVKQQKSKMTMKTQNPMNRENIAEKCIHVLIIFSWSDTC